MADISQFYPGNDNHPVDEAGAARSIDQRGFDNAAQGPLPEGHYLLAHWTTSDTPGGTPPGFIVTPGSNDLFLPDGQIFTPSGTGIDPTTAETRYVRRDVSQTFDGTIARANLGLGGAAVRDDAFFARANHEHTASDITDFGTAVTTAIGSNTEVDANTAARHDAVTLTGNDYLTLSGQAITVGDIDLTTDVDGRLPLANIDVNGENGLANLIDQRAAAVGSVHRFNDNAAFIANTVLPWHVGDIIIITGTATPAEPTTYLWVGNAGNSNRNNLDDLQQITVSGGGISQATGDGRYIRFGSDGTLTADQATQARTNIGLGNSSTRDVGTGATDVASGDHNHRANTLEMFSEDVTAVQAVMDNSDKTSFPGFGTTAMTAATGDHNHDGRYIRYDDSQTLSSAQRSQFFNNVGAFSGLVFGGRLTQPTTLAAQNLYQLNNILNDTTVTLPPGVEGAEIKIQNISSLILTRPSTPRVSGTWTIAPAEGERISTLPANETLVLDNKLASFSLVYTDADGGWAILGLD